MFRTSDSPVSFVGSLLLEVTNVQAINVGHISLGSDFHKGYKTFVSRQM
jgi:hypothetical protein